MAVTLLAVECPPPVVPSGVYAIDGIQLTSDFLIQGDTDPLIPKFNHLALSSDLAYRYGGGFYALAVGYTLTAGAGLVLNVAAGTALIDGRVTMEIGTTLNLMDGHSGAAPAGAYIWLSRAGALLVDYDTLVPPPGFQVFLGRVQTAAGAITQIDTSGVFGALGGLPIRRTVDAVTPTDTPPAGIAFLTISSTGMWFWTGAEYYRINATVAPPAAVYTPSNVTTDRSYDANLTTLNELADVLGSLIADLQAAGIIA